MMKNRKVPFATLLVGALLTVASRGAGAAVVTITDCVNDPNLVKQSKTTKVDVGTDDLVIQCALLPLPGTERFDLRANNITVQGSAGSIMATGKSPSIRLTAIDEIVLTNTTLTSDNGNGGFFIRSGNGITITNSVLDISVTAPPSFGKKLSIQCTNVGCPITLTNTQLRGNRIEVIAQGDLTGSGNTFTTGGPRPRIDKISRGGKIDLTGAAGGGGGQAGPKCNGGGGGGGGQFGTNEGRIRDIACTDIILDGQTIRTGRFITITAGTCGAGNISLVNAIVNNDFGKPGEIVITAAGGAGMIDIDGAQITDDDDKGQVDVSEMNGREQVPHTGFNNVVGTPLLDN
jgi:hypothetical protein